MDMAELARMLERLELRPGDRVIDIGCGAGVISEHIAERTGAHVVGVDSSGPAMEAAAARTAGRETRVEFSRGDLSAIELPEGPFDAAILIDSIYWATDMRESLAAIAATLEPGGRIAIVIALYPELVDGPAALEIDGTDVSVALTDLGLDFTAHDWTKDFEPFWIRVKESVVALREDFESEGNGFICDELEREADESFLPAIEAGTLRRYMYYVRL